MKSVRGDKTARVLTFFAIGILLALCDAFWAGLRINEMHNFPVGDRHWKLRSASVSLGFFLENTNGIAVAGLQYLGPPP
jgi:hypothetical protein